MASQASEKVVKGPIDVGKPSRRRYRVATAPDGSKVRIRMLDADSPTFSADFLDMFKENVRRARAENKALGLDVD